MDEASNKILEKLLIKYKKMEDVIETIDPEIIDDEEDLITPEEEEEESDTGSE